MAPYLGLAFLLILIAVANASQKALAFLAVLLCVFAMVSPNMAGVIAVVSLSFCLSRMFPTIYGVALKGLGPATKFGAAGLVPPEAGSSRRPRCRRSWTP